MFWQPKNSPIGPTGAQNDTKKVKIQKVKMKERQTVRKRISGDKKSKGQSGMVDSIASSLGHQILYRMGSRHRWRLSEALMDVI